jgi:aminoglycoside 6'-N-acetyltransferase
VSLSGVIMKSFEFKPLCENDLELLHHWFQEATIKQFYARGQSFTLEDIKNKYLPRIAGQEKVPSFIAYHDNNPIGFIQYYFITENSLPEGVRSYNNPLFKQYSPNELVGIDCFIATAENRGKGLGREIINNFITEFLLNFKTIIVDPNKNNESAIRCYEKAGFEASTYSEDSDYLVMLKTTHQSMTPISIKNAPHYSWGNACDGWWLKKDGSFNVISEKMPSGTSEKKHYHKFVEQFFYCLQGRLLIQFSDKKIMLSEHEGCVIPAGEHHKVMNPTDEEIHFLVISSPNTHNDRIDLE